ncbi:MAG: dTDP-4-dehydrorhamnose reductase [Negativicutes bacterium]|nr:dTDP-4-dehydrorhamnose reductase [Negativicutes bacterium]
MIQYLVFGGNGQLGRALTGVWQGRGAEFRALTRAEADISDREAVRQVLAKWRPKVVVNAAAYTRVDQAETDVDDAWRVNALGAQNVALACQEHGVDLVHISTDYVFAGNNIGRGYSEEDQTGPASVYGRSKLAGERLVAHGCRRSIIIRTAWLYGDGPNFVRSIVRLARRQSQLTVVDDQWGCPTSAADLAGAVDRLSGLGAYGLYHFVNDGQVSWYGFARAIVAAMGLPAEVRPISSDELLRPAPRPAWSVLDTRLYRMVSGCRPRPWRVALDEYIAEGLAEVNHDS